MTLEEAKKQIEEDMNGCWKAFEVSRSRKCELEANILHDVLTMLENVEPAGIPDRMTLIELVRELRKILPRTRCVTVGDNPKASIVGDKIVSIFYERDGHKPEPEYNKDPMRPNTWGQKHPKLKVYGKPFYAPGIYQFYVNEIADLDLSEYADADGNIDYSKCIVEVE